jgi:hypothetical protein
MTKRLHLLLNLENLEDSFHSLVKVEQLTVAIRSVAIKNEHNCVLLILHPSVHNESIKNEGGLCL